MPSDMTVRLIRVAKNNVCIEGVVVWDDTAQYVSLEPPWRNNQVAQSCIPQGTYNCSLHKSPKHGDCFLVHDVPGRSEILIHKGNTSRDTEGCILVGRNFGRLDRQPAVLNSGFALKDWLRRFDYLGVRRFVLEIMGV